MKETQAEAIVIRKADMGEADKLLTVLADGHGKLLLAAKGLRRPRAKMAAWLDMFRCNHLTWVAGRGFPVVTGAQTAEGLLHADLDWDRLTVAYHICELVDKLIEDGEDLSGLYLLVKDSLRALANKDLNEGMIRASFEMKLMQMMGIAPELHRCVVSGEELRSENEIYFSPRLGGATQQGGDDFAKKIGADDLKMLRLFMQYPPELIGRIRVDEGVLQRAVESSGEFLRFRLETRLKSLAVAGQMGGV